MIGRGSLFEISSGISLRRWQSRRRLNPILEVVSQTLPPSSAIRPDGGVTATPLPQAQFRQPPRAWNDAPLVGKTAALVGASVLGGVIVGMVEAHTRHSGWVLGIGVPLLIGWMVILGRLWICYPIERILAWWRVIHHNRTPGALDDLPIGRHDEAGELARAFYQLTVHSIRRDYEARQLRRTLDHRIAEATRQATQQLRRLAMRDPLTNLGNRRFLEQTLEPLVKSVLDSRSTLACVSMDADCFKEVNDTLGHAAGDDLLVFLASLIRGNIRQEDYAIRLGGDEFLILMPDCEPQRLQKILDRIRMLFKQYVAGSEMARLPVDLSLGVAFLPASGISTGQALLEKADANLYAAKRAGKGRVVGINGQ